ncbi:MAG TPA: hypothetical protein VMV72_18935 [Verrucomicrobiae bacterium]|nr:hypothetical protein [Verrucomicrobiae bacterium]
MSRRTVFVALLTMMLFLVPGVSLARWMNANTGRFQTMDSYEGGQEEPLSLHRYLYGQDDPVNRMDLSGNDAVEAVAVTDIGASLGSFSGFSVSAPKALSSGSTCGPDITKALMLTMEDVAQAYKDASIYKKAYMRFLTPVFMGGGWDIAKVSDVGFDNPVDFGNGSSLGTGLGKLTVQFGNPPKVYYASAVNYVLWGEMFSLLEATYGNVLYSEPDAELWARAYKAVKWGDSFNSMAKETSAFVKYGYASTADPSSTALPLAPNPENIGASSRFKWQWKRLHDTYQ